VADRLTHLDSHGSAHMVDVGDKQVTHRVAVAEATIRMKPETLAMIVEGRAPKGDVFAIARIAGIQAAKRTADLIPAVPPRSRSRRSRSSSNRATRAYTSTATCATDGKTGIEIGSPSPPHRRRRWHVYDTVQGGRVAAWRLADVRLLEKSGGASGHWTRTGDGLTHKED